MELVGIPADLRGDLDTKFNRYSTDAGGARSLNFSGLKYMLKSVPGSHLEALPEARLEELFLEAAGAGATKRGRCVLQGMLHASRAPVFCPARATRPAPH